MTILPTRIWAYVFQLGKINAFVSFRNTNRKLIYTERPLKIRQKEKNQVSGRGLTCEAKTRKDSKEDIKNNNIEKKENRHG